MTVDNPYWDAVKDFVSPTTWPFAPEGSLAIDLFDKKGTDGMDGWRLRRVVTKDFAWTVTDPIALMFVVSHSRGAIIDPMAGTGYWAYLLNQLEIDCLAFDECPPSRGSDANGWHRDAATFFPIEKLDAVEAVKAHAEQRTLFLSWPPMTPAAHDTLAAYPGSRLIYIGEGAQGCTADESFFELLGEQWELTAAHRPVQFDGIHDIIYVYDRSNQIPAGS